MAPRIKMTVIFNLNWSKFVESMLSRYLEADRNVAHRFNKLATK